MLTDRQILERLEGPELAPLFGVVRRISANAIEADGPPGAVGGVYRICCGDGSSVFAEAVAIEGGRVALSPMGPAAQVRLDDRVVATRFSDETDVGDGFAGRCVNALGQPIDGLGPLHGGTRRALDGLLPTPMDRRSPTEPLVTGIKAIDALLTLGQGQRVGIFAASGVGKTSLVEQVIDQAKVDRIVVCLVGERGREVEAVWAGISDRRDRKKFAVVAATSDDSASARARAPMQALALAEHWRGQGEHVLLVIDSVTRLAMALRELGLSAGAPPTVRAYTPNVFVALPRLVERCGAVKAGGAISALMTVLTETDDVDDPIAETMKSLLDGHLILSRTLAEQGQFPAIDVTRSVSRGVEKRVDPKQRDHAVEAIAMLSAWQDARVMIETGAYRQGANPLVDRAIQRLEPIRAFLKQPQNQFVDLKDSIAQLKTALGVTA